LIRRYTTIFFAVLILSIGLIEPLSRPSFADVIDERKRGIENPPPFGHVSTLHTLVCQMVTTAPFYVAAWQSPSFYFDTANDASARFPALYLTIATTIIFAAVAIWKIFFAAQDAATIAAGGPIAFLIMQGIRILSFFAASSVLLANCPPRIIIADLPSSFVGDLEVEPQVHPITGRVYPVVTGASTIHDNPVIQTEIVPGHADFLNTPVPPFACNVEIKIDKNLLRNPPLSIPPLDPAVQFGDLQPYSVDYPPSFELIFDRLVRWETDISEIVGDENIKGDHDTFIFKVGSYKISFVVAVPEIPLTNLVQLQLDVLEEIRPNLVAEDRTFQSVFPQGALAGVIEKSIITNALNDPDTRDDCTPNDELELTTNFRQIPELSVNSAFLPLGEYDVTLTLRDFSGNEDSKTIKITVEDTIPPDILQPDDLGVSVDPGSGGIDGFTLLNGGHPNPDDEALLTPPLTFDLATLQPDIECIVNNSQSTDLDCESAFFPSGEISTVTWTATDLVGNSQDIMQQVNVKQRGANNPPQAISQLVKVAQGIPKEIIVKGTDPDFDQLSFFITNNPILGGFVEPLDPIFQTRFSIAGTISELKSFQLRDESVSNKGNFLVTIADPLQQRLVIFNEGEGTIEANLDLSSLGIIPNVNTGPLGSTEGPFEIKNFIDMIL